MTTRPGSKRSRDRSAPTTKAAPADTATAELESSRQAAELAAFRRMLIVSEGTFSLSFAVCTNRTLRDGLIEQLSAEFPGIEVVALPGDTIDVYETVRSLIETRSVSEGPNARREARHDDARRGSPDPAETADRRSPDAGRPLVGHVARSGDRPQQQPDSKWLVQETGPNGATPPKHPVSPIAIFVTDLEPLLPAEATDQPVLAALNLSREQWEEFKCPVVFWLAEYAAALVATKAVDLWRYRSHTFEFVAPALESGQWQAESFPGYEMIAGLPFEEKKFRRAELEQRIRQAGTPPSPQMLPHVLAWMFELAELHRIFSDFQSAGALLRDAIRLCQEEYGVDSAESAAALNDLASLLHDSNRLAEAESLIRRALEIDERSYGPDHASVSRDLNNLALVLQATHRQSEAEPLLRRALAIDEQVYGTEHGSVSMRLNNLGALLKETNRLEEAEQLFRRALAIDEKLYGPEHPALARSLNNLATLLQDTNRLKEAEHLLRRALAIDEQSYGFNHPSVANRINNLATLLYTMNRLTEANALMRRCIEILRQFGDTSGHEHPQMQSAIENYGEVLKAMNLPEAEIADRLRQTGEE